MTECRDNCESTDEHWLRVPARVRDQHDCLLHLRDHGPMEVRIHPLQAQLVPHGTRACGVHDAPAIIAR